MHHASDRVLKFCDYASPSNQVNDACRYALYYAPAQGSEWERFGSQWFARVAEAPRRYGFHATLKAPFRLAKGASPAELVDELERYCSARRAWAMPALKIALLGDFLALVPEEVDPAINVVAAECVTQFDRFRAPLDERDLARRKPERLDAVELRLLNQWGYPHVLERFHFHLSLTGPLAGTDPARIAALTVEAGKAMGALGRPVFDAICVFEEPHAGGDFKLVKRVPLSD